jgi:hypothetical protein
LGGVVVDAAIQIGLVRENLALAIALWAAAERGVITAGFVPSRSEFVTPDGRAVKVYTPLEVHDTRELVRCVNNQVRGAFAFSVLQANRVLEAVYGNSPIQAPQSNLQAARCILYLLSKSVSRDLLRPAWDCPPEYRRSFSIPEASFVLDASQLHGRKVCWDQFGGLQKYLDLLQYCSEAVGSRPAEFQEHLQGRGLAEEETSLSVLPRENDAAAPVPVADAPPPAVAVPAAEPSPCVDTLDDDSAPVVEMPPEVMATPAAEPSPAVDAAGGPAEARETRLQDAGVFFPAEVGEGADLFTDFVETGCVVSPREMIIAKDLYDGYVAWCRDRGHEPLAQRSFGMRLTALGFQRRRRGRGRHWWLGIRLARAH